MNILWSIIVGLIAGAIAKFIMPGKDPGGIIVTMIIGVVGAVLFTFLGRMLGLYGEDDGAGIFGAILGALIVLWIYRLITRKRSVI